MTYSEPKGANMLRKRVQDRMDDRKSDPRQHTSQSTDWYSEGQCRVVRVNDVEVTIRYVVRKGRRARIAIQAPPGAVFMDPSPSNPGW